MKITIKDIFIALVDMILPLSLIVSLAFMANSKDFETKDVSKNNSRIELKMNTNSEIKTH